MTRERKIQIRGAILSTWRLRILGRMSMKWFNLKRVYGRTTFAAVAIFDGALAGGLDTWVDL